MCRHRSQKSTREQFVEIMIDEYQDSNLIQEALLTSVSTIWEDKYNIFMVGDVKAEYLSFPSVQTGDFHG